MMSQTAQIINFGDYAHLAMSPTDREHWSSEYIGASLPMDWDAFQLVRGRDRDFLLFACDCACQQHSPVTTSTAIAYAVAVGDTRVLPPSKVGHPAPRPSRQIRPPIA